MTRLPTLWSISGLDTAGGAGLSADQRAADAIGAHLCPVVACLTAQHSLGVDAAFPVPADQLDAQLQALAADLPPRAIKTGLLGSVAAIETVARWVDRLRAQAPAGTDPHRHLALVVDPVLRASAGGADFSNEATVAAYRQHLLPRATVITPNRDEALALLGRQACASSDADFEHVPDLGVALQATGARAVLVTGGDARQGPHDERFSLDWLSSPEAEGWLCAPRVDTPHHHGSGCTLASALAAALAIGHAPADACVLGRMVVHHALLNARAAGQGRGPVVAQRGAFAGPAQGGAPLPWLGIGRELPWRLVPEDGGATRFASFHPPSDKLYGILPDGASLVAAVEAGLRCVQLRHKAASGVDPALTLGLQAAARHGAALFVNDHWRAALRASLPEAVHPRFQLGIHLGQEDLLALSAADRAELRSQRGRMLLGLSSHCPWELARAVGCGPSYVACGPIQATTTKDMPWLPQGEGNLRWWISQADAPVVAIGGLVTPEDLGRHAGCNPAALCVVRALQVPSHELSGRLSSLRLATRLPAVRAPVLPPHPCLPHAGQPPRA
jgi:hydroxymethylpyrimidine kinase/phosphomethylpyrimidine kinase/thiamine-phosphate diphosphorylase